MNGTCRFCGQLGTGDAFQKWVRPTFTDHDKLLPGEIICDACRFWFDEQSVLLAERMGKDKPQRMRTYSHFIVNGEWTPLSKAHKARMRTLLLTPPFPELAVIADSGQKHLVFRATRNPPGAGSGCVQFEETELYVEPDALAARLSVVDALYETFAKSEIETSRYAGYRIQQFGIERWLTLENRVKGWRGQPLFALALFLAQKMGHDESHTHDHRGTADAGGDPAAGDLAGNFARSEESLPDDHLAAVRGRDRERGLHQQPGEIRQCALWPTGRDHRDAPAGTDGL